MNKNKVYNIASSFISENKLFDYPLDIYEVCKMYNWKIKFYSKKDNKEFFRISTDGFVVEKNNNYTIFLNKNMIENRKRFTIAHEIGYIVLGHHNLDGYNLIANSGLDTEVEQEANMFARLILCPSQITKYLPKNPIFISKLLNVSHQMAELTLKYSYSDLQGMQDIFDICYENSIHKFLKIIDPNINFSMWDD